MGSRRASDGYQRVEQVDDDLESRTDGGNRAELSLSSVGGEDGVVHWGQDGGVPYSDSRTADNGGASDFKLPPPASGSKQLEAMLRRQWLFKKRGMIQTIMELISPLLMISLLVLGWARSTPDHYDSAVFANASLPEFNKFTDTFMDTRNFIHNCPPAMLVKQNLSLKELQLLARLMTQQLQANGGQAINFNLTAANATLFDDLMRAQNQGDPNELAAVTPELLLLALKCVDTAQEIISALDLIDQYNGPLPVPSFDTYVAAHKLIKAALDSQQGKFDDVVALQKRFGNVLGNLLQLGQVTFTPNTPQVADLVDYMSTNYQFFNEVYGGTFPTEKDALDWALRGSKEPLWAIIVVKHLDIADGKVDYTIRMNYTTVPRTWRTVHKRRRGMIDKYKDYYTSGFLSLQNAVNSYVFKNLTIQQPGVLVDETVWGAPFPVGEYTHNRFYDVVGPLMGLVMCLSTLYPLAMLVKALVEEKETRAKETMRIMGLKPWVFNLSWLSTYLVTFFLISVSVSVVLKLTYFPKSDIGVVFTLFYLFTASLIPFGFFLSVFFSKSKLAAIVAPFVHFAAIMPRYIFFRSNSSQAIAGKTATALLPSTAFTFGVDLLGQFEGENLGLTWSNLWDDEFSMAWIFVLLATDFILYGALAWYLEQILPSEYGGRLKPWFLFTPRYWFGDKTYRLSAEYEMLGTDSDKLSWDDQVEPMVGEDHRPAVQVNNLRKVFHGGKVAVDGLSLTIYEDQITALLGHNGAGKSTTISMLTGLTRPTSGDAEIWGHSIHKDLSSIRRTIGVCPQQNVLFGVLTVREHLELFAALKGIPEKLITEEVEDMVERLGLTDKMDARSASLSGGMKRKLQVAIAMIGGSKVVFLDEPTSGMDPHARRGMWDLLRTFKQGRAIVLTTHYMDEADLLCDRIAIMSEGRLRCCGSSLYLKAKFGVGYNLTMTKLNQTCNEKAVQDLIQEHVPQAVPLSSAGGEMAFQLPVANKAAFSNLFFELEQHKSALQIGGYGVSMTTLEEVFIKLANENSDFFGPGGKPAQVLGPETLNLNLNGHGKNEDNNFLALDVENKQVDFASNGRTTASNEGDPASNHSAGGFMKKQKCSFYYAWLQLVKKRAIIARRDVKGLLNTILLPVAVIAFVMLILKLNIDPSGPKLALQFDMYKGTFRSLGLPYILDLPVAGVPVSSLPVIGREGHVRLDGRQDVQDSIEMSELLLRTISDPPRFGALIFNDTLLPQYNTSGVRNVNLTDIKTLYPNSTFADTLPDGMVGDFRVMQTPSGRGLWSGLTLLHNTSSEHAMPTLIQELAQARLREALNLSTASMKLSNSPLPLTKNEALRIQVMLTVLAALFILIPFCYLAASFAVFVVRERVVKAKLLQMLSGANTYSYWTATYCWDILNYIAIVGITMLVFVLYRDQAFIGSWTKAGAVFVLLISFGLSVLPLSYCYSFAFTSHANAQVAIAGIHFVTGFVTLVASTVMGALPETKELNRYLVQIFQLFPPYNLGRGLVTLSAMDLQSTFVHGHPNLYRWGVLGRPITLMLMEAVGYMLLTLTIDNDWLTSIWKLVVKFSRKRKSTSSSLHAAAANGDLSSPEDEDVHSERERVESGMAHEDAVTIRKLWKVYPGHGNEPAKVAVKDLCLGISSGECFGFLGVNGAGKTTTLSILSGDIKPTSGNAFIKGHSVVTNMPTVQKYIGYCPQFDPLLDLMTAREHLDMYARLKGVPDIRVKSTVDEVLEAAGLQKYADQVSGVYSGGNKRKLALAIALVGDPAVVFLDEPSSGMDPVARRSMWDLVQDAVNNRQVSMVLTTHSMEECEALCGRVGVMVSGRLMCLGSIQHLKSRFGSGYNLEMRCKRPEDMQRLHEFITRSFPGSKLDEQHNTRVKYCIPLEGVSLSKVFGVIEAEKDLVGLEDYSVSQSSLEQIFISFAKGRDSGDSQ
ncbi:hypothetical protein AXG93_4193s1240 [Marchantia polymorpha subsp. ruderalis]|uniref:ABC transporter domain-containing protein n=1 Tax=Marchantia polymorpha subsp. ruderalis TaxID=1480154 RepID=A0A176W3W2_MARPO|nr:hypothetical protein AXG93_4193s1240 [Marchantia polymorpha subsp. ruderalis]